MILEGDVLDDLDEYFCGELDQVGRVPAAALLPPTAGSGAAGCPTGVGAPGRWASGLALTVPLSIAVCSRVRPHP